ncbi:MAG: glycosyltransferase, partial [Methylococcales bacterium]
SWLVKTVTVGTLAKPVQRFYQGMRRRIARKLVSIFGFDVAWVERANHWITPELADAACKTPAELYIAHNLAALPAAVKAARIHGARVIFDAEDFHSGELPEGSAWDFDRDLISALEKYYLPKCDAMTAASPGIARAYAETYSLTQPLVVLNVFPLAQAPMAASKKGMMKPGPSLYWFSQTVGPDRGLEAAVQAIGLAKCRPHLYLRGNVSENYREKLLAIARSNDMLDHLHFLAVGAPADMVKLAAEFDIGLAAEPGHSENNRLACSNKIFTYLLAGVPTLASSTPAQAELAGMATNAVWLYPPEDSHALAAKIDHLLGDSQKMANARTVAWDLGQQHFNWEVECKTWLKQVEKLLAVQALGKKHY